MNKHLYDEIAKRWYRGGSVWIYSDPHFGDEEMKTLRANYISDDEQVKRINSKVGKNDTIVFLGDIGDTSYIKKIRGYKVLIMGNHDKGASNYKREYEEEFDHTGHYEDNPEEFDEMKRNGWVIEDEHFTKYYSDSYAVVDAVLWKRVKDNHLFDEVYEGPLMVSDRLILSHEPFPTSITLFNIHGHDHNGHNKADNSLNVCAEHINYTPVNLTALIKDGLLKSVISSHRETINKANKRLEKKYGKVWEENRKNNDKSLQSEN